MYAMVRYEEMAVKAILSLIIAVLIVLCGIMILGINITTCNMAVLAGGVGFVTFILWICSVIKL